jgi:hypothetical protein
MGQGYEVWGSLQVQLSGLSLDCRSSVAAVFVLTFYCIEGNRGWLGDGR